MLEKKKTYMHACMKKACFSAKGPIRSTCQLTDFLAAGAILVVGKPGLNAEEGGNNLYVSNSSNYIYYLR